MPDMLSQIRVQILRRLSGGDRKSPLNIFQLVAGINQQVLFSLRNNDGGHFKVNPKSGLIQLAKQLDRETTSSHHITVVATDQVC